MCDVFQVEHQKKPEKLVEVLHDIELKAAENGYLHVYFITNTIIYSQ